MTETIKKTWELLGDTIKIVSEENPEIELDNNAYNDYEQHFSDWYECIKKEYMTEDVSYLDRHKIAAIVITCILESNAVLCSQEVPPNKRFIGQYLVAASVGITYMQDRLNEILIQKHQNPIAKIWMPEIVFSCNVPYFDIFGRNLYFAHNTQKCGLNPLDISKELFLLEYITVKEKGIDPHILKEKKKKK